MNKKVLAMGNTAAHFWCSLNYVYTYYVTHYIYIVTFQVQHHSIYKVGATAQKLDIQQLQVPY